ncbi:uncharacterized protein B0H64DRAFT_26424 [Chaetomium fimeti]|jgi:hypothetical protein|uniref:Uncharacterized protein n=1 Tax=Chaetomium fimeti TaxID=1854472 RepID=A0AAE0HQQ4_9PEZI|nr:hypothetical protein B0H64DRAFT_26424 [Chaetomium fimeti]
MAVSIKIQPSGFVMPTGPAVVLVKVHREAFRHLAPDMNPLSDADTISTVLRKGKPAVAYTIRQLSNMLFGGDIEPSVIRRVLPYPEVGSPEDSPPLLMSKYVCFYWLRNIPAGEQLSSALVELTSASEPIDNYLDFHAVEVADDNDRVDSIKSIFVDEARLDEDWAED